MSPASDQEPRRQQPFAARIRGALSRLVRHVPFSHTLRLPSFISCESPEGFPSHGDAVPTLTRAQRRFEDLHLKALDEPGMTLGRRELRTKHSICMGPLRPGP